MTGPVVDVVPLAKTHLEAVMAIDAQVYPKPWSKKLWHSELGRTDRIYRVALDHGRVVGHIGIMLVDQDAHVMTVAVGPAVQGRRIGTRLLVSVIPAALAAGSRALTLEVRVSNKGAQALYRRFGMAPVGVRKAYYEPDGEDALVMWADDIASDAYATRLASIEETLEVAA